MDILATKMTSFEFIPILQIHKSTREAENKIPLGVFAIIDAFLQGSIQSYRQKEESSRWWTLENTGDSLADTVKSKSDKLH